MTDLLDVAQACDYLGDIHRATLYRLMKRGKVKWIKVGGSTRFRKVELDRYLRDRERSAAA